ncbi:MAG: hypothetical protein ACRD2F_04175 [Terriglobales bacterium]
MKLDVNQAGTYQSANGNITISRQATALNNEDHTATTGPDYVMVRDQSGDGAIVRVDEKTGQWESTKLPLRPEEDSGGA